MTQDEYEVGSLENAEKFAIIRMAREAGLIRQRGNLDVVKNSISQLERFADLVAAHEREKHLNLANEVAWSVALAEREACAKVCEGLINEETCYVWIPDARGAVNNCAAAIRSRSNEH